MYKVGKRSGIDVGVKTSGPGKFQLGLTNKITYPGILVLGEIPLQGFLIILKEMYTDTDGKREQLGIPPASNALHACSAPWTAGRFLLSLPGFPRPPPLHSCMPIRGGNIKCAAATRNGLFWMDSGLWNPESKHLLFVCIKNFHM